MKKKIENGEIVYTISQKEKQQLDTVLKQLFSMGFEELVQ